MTMMTGGDRGWLWALAGYNPYSEPCGYLDMKLKSKLYSFFPFSLVLGTAHLDIMGSNVKYNDTFILGSSLLPPPPSTYSDNKG